MLGWLRLTAPDRKDDRGAVAILFAIFLIVFMILLAFVVDLGQVYARKAQMQGVVDAAALAGAGVLNCTGSNSGAASAEALLYGQSYNGQLVTPAVNGTTVRTSATSQVKTFFGGFAGRPSIDVFVDATATKDCNGGYAAFAGTASFDSAGGVTINGGVYSGAQAKFTGQNTVTGNIDVVGGSCQGSCKDASNNALVINNVAAKAPACYAYEIGLYGNGGTACSPAKTNNTGLIETQQALTPAIPTGTGSQCTVNAAWFVTNSTIKYLKCAGDITVSAWSNSSPLVLIQAGGKIILSGDFKASNSEPTKSTGSSTNPVTFYSTSTASDAIKIQGDNSLNHFGYLFAPAGSLEANGSGNLSWTGSLIAKGIDINGTGSGGGTAGFLALAGTPRLTE